MADSWYNSRSTAPLTRARLRSSTRDRRAGEADPLPPTELPNDKPIPAEHTSPEDVSPDRPEDGNETFEHEVRRIDPTHFEPTKREAGLADELAQPGPAAPTAATPPADQAQPSAAPEQAPSQPDPAAPAPTPQPATDDAAVPGADPALQGEQGGGKPVFDFENGLDPASKGRLVNDWQTAVDGKLFSRHTNVIKIEDKGNVGVFTVQAFNTDPGAKPDTSTGYAADGLQRGELMGRLREIFQPNGPAVGHVTGVYNDFIEEQADQGAMALTRLKPVSSQFEFIPQEREIEGWQDTGLGRDPIWRATQYTVYLVRLMIQYATIGG